MDEDSDEEDLLNEYEQQKNWISNMEKAQTIIGKYKTSELRKTHPHSKESWLIHTIRGIIRTTDRIMKPHKFHFRNNRDAAKHNTKLLKRYRTISNKL